MAEALTAAQRATIEQTLSQHPEIIQAIRADAQKISGRQKFLTNDPRFQKSPAEVLKQYGIDFPDAGDYQIQVDPQGNVHLDRQNWFQRNADWVLPVATIGTGGVANAAAAGPAASGGSTTLGTAGPLSADEAFTAGPIAGGGMGAVEGGGALAAGAAAKTPSLLHDLLPTIIGAGANLAGTGIAAHANTEAAKIAAEQADKALALQKEQYALQRQDTAPYRALGQGAVGNLGYLSGIDVDSKVPALSATVPTTPYGQAPAAPQGPSLATLGQPQPSSGLVSVKNPATGLVHLIPQNQVAEAQQHGGVLV